MSPASFVALIVLVGMSLLATWAAGIGAGSRYADENCMRHFEEMPHKQAVELCNLIIHGGPPK
jgi:hypothetical protein